MNKYSKIYSSIPFQRHINHKDWTIFTAEPQKTQKTPFLPYSLKNKIVDLPSHEFSYYLSHNFFLKIGPPQIGVFFFGGGVASSQQSILSLLAYLYLNYIACKGLSCVFGHPMFIYLLMYTIRDDPDFLSF